MLGHFLFYFRYCKWRRWFQNLGCFIPWLNTSICNGILQINNVFDFEDFPFLNKGKDESQRSEKDMMSDPFFYNFSILSLINLELDRNQIWHLYRSVVQKIEIKQILKITPSTHQFLLHLDFHKLYQLSRIGHSDPLQS